LCSEPCSIGFWRSLCRIPVVKPYWVKSVMAGLETGAETGAGRG
jgi:hypothetical protein